MLKKKIEKLVITIYVPWFGKEPLSWFPARDKDLREDINLIHDGRIPLNEL